MCWCIYLFVNVQARRQEFPEGGSSTRTARRAPRGARCYCGRIPGVIGVKSYNLAISRNFILTFRKSCFYKKIFYIYFILKILDFISHSLNKTLTLIVIICFQVGEKGCTNPSNPHPTPWLRVWWTSAGCQW